MVEIASEVLNGYALRAAKAYFKLSSDLSGGKLSLENIEPTLRARQTASEVLTIIGLVQVARIEMDGLRTRMTDYVLDQSRSREI